MKTVPTRAHIAELQTSQLFALLELRKAHALLAIAQNCLKGDALRAFTRDAKAAGLDTQDFTAAELKADGLNVNELNPDGDTFRTYHRASLLDAQLTRMPALIRRLHRISKRVAGKAA